MFQLRKHEQTYARTTYPHEIHTKLYSSLFHPLLLPFINLSALLHPHNLSVSLHYKRQNVDHPAFGTWPAHVQNSTQGQR